MWSSGEVDRKRAGVIVSSDEIEATVACVLPRLCVGDRGSELTSLTIVIEGKMAVTMVALHQRQLAFISRNVKLTSQLRLD